MLLGCRIGLLKVPEHESTIPKASSLYNFLYSGSVHAAYIPRFIPADKNHGIDPEVSYFGSKPALPGFIGAASRWPS